jgi:hypothetical protein
MSIAHTPHKMIVVRGRDVSIKESLNLRMTLRSYRAQYSNVPVDKHLVPNGTKPRRDRPKE